MWDGVGVCGVCMKQRYLYKKTGAAMFTICHFNL